MYNQRILYQGQFDFGTVSVFSKADIIERRQKRFQQTIQKSLIPVQSYQTSIQLNGDFIDLESSSIPVFFETTSLFIKLLVKEALNFKSEPESSPDSSTAL